MRWQTMAAPVQPERIRRLPAGEEPGARLDYFAIVDPETLDPVAEVAGGALVAVAAYFGNTRLIDNIVLAPASIYSPSVE